MFRASFLTLAVLTTASTTIGRGSSGPGSPVQPSAPALPDAPAKKTLRWLKNVDPDTMKEYEKTAQAVWDKLVMKFKPGKDWPKNLGTKPAFKIVDEVETRNGPTEYNAVASKLWDDEKKEAVKVEGKFVPLVRITRGFLEIFRGDEDALALILGHELGHHALGHTVRDGGNSTAASTGIEGHRMEADADLYGARLMLEAEFSLRKGVKIWWTSLDARGSVASAAASTCSTHPADTDRVARMIALTDKKEATLWRQMQAFENGVTFLESQNYLAAEVCFQRVLDEFPKCYEAATNLGLARLMRYFDGLGTEDIRLLGVAHFLGSPYRTSASVIGTRKGDAELWYKAVEALMKAKDLKPDSPLVLANLSLAYLVHPAGKDVGTALQFLVQAEAAFAKTADLTPQVRMGMLINFAVVHIANGDVAKGRKQIDAAVVLAKTKVYGKIENWPISFRGVVAFNTATAVKDSDQFEALGQYETFLTLVPRSNPWWEAAFEQYEALCRAAKVAPKPAGQLGKINVVRKQHVVTLKSGKLIHVGQAREEALAALGRPTSETKIAGTGVSRLQFDAHGLYLVVDQDEVYAIVVTGEAGPRIALQEFGAGGKVVGELRLGLTRAEVKKLPGRAEPVLVGFLAKDKDGIFIDYDYYPDLGVAVLYDAYGKVSALLIARL